MHTLRCGDSGSFPKVGKVVSKRDRNQSQELVFSDSTTTQAKRMILPLAAWPVAVRNIFLKQLTKKVLSKAINGTLIAKACSEVYGPMKIR
jgi:hypothetical protein